MADAVPQISGVLQLAIPVRDISRATAFYRDALGLKFLMGAPHMAFFACGGLGLYLDTNHRSQQASPAPPVVFFGRTDSFNPPLPLSVPVTSSHHDPPIYPP